MILYLAGSLSPERLTKIGRMAGAYTFLETYAHRDAQECAKYISQLPRTETEGWRMFVDSGAFTLWAKGGKVDLDAYISFCKELKAKAKCPIVFANLDVIPGKKGGEGVPTEAMLEKSCEEGWKNYLKMKAAGLEPLPTFHQFEDEKWLKRYMNDTDYIGLAPRKAGVRKAKLKDQEADDSNEWFLAECFKFVGFKPDSKTPARRLHGLGVASPRLMEMFPFYSVDSTAWLQGGRANAYRIFLGRQAELIQTSEWKNNHHTCVPAIDRYRLPGEANENCEYGSYFFAMRCMEVDVKLEKYITELWRLRGVVWED